MAQFGVAPARFDPYANFAFRVRWDGRHVAGVSKVSALSSMGDTPVRHTPGAVTLERGVTQDSEFDTWARSSPSECRKDVILEQYSQARQLRVTWHAYRCWVSEYRALPDPGAHETVVVIETLTLQCEGLERAVSAPPSRRP